MKTNTPAFSIPFLIIFIGLCVFPWADTLFNADPAAPLSENRPLAAVPEWPSGITALNQFPDKCGAFFNDHFGFRRRLLHIHGGIMVRAFNTSPNPQVILGSDHWLFYEPDVRYLTSSADGGFFGAKGSPLKAIIDFNRQLRDRNIRLIVVPVPVKSMFHPEKIPLPFNTPDGYPRNPAFAQLKRELEKKGILVMDPADVMEKMKRSSPHPIFLRTDTHWTPEAMTTAARGIAAYIEGRTELSPRRPGAWKAVEMEISSRGDLAGMLPLAIESNPAYAEKARIRRIVSDAGEPWAPDRNAEILFLGDSFANIFSSGDLGWGESAGLVEHLSFFLGRPIDRICRNDNGAFAARQSLQSELSRGRDRLKNKKVVVWEFAVRELAFGDWKLLDLKLGEKKTGAFFTPAPGEEAVVTGVVDAMSEKPVPGKSPYKDHVMSLRLVDVSIGAPDAESREALVYILSMKDYRPAGAADVRIGQTITIRLKNWNDVADEYNSINRSEIDDEELMLADPCWGEEIMK